MQQRLYALALCGMLVSAVGFWGCASKKTPGDMMRMHADERAELVEIKKQLADDYERGEKLVKTGEKRMKKGEKRIRSAEETMKQGREDMDAGKREIEEGRRLMRQSEQTFRQTFPKLPLMETN